MIQEAIFRSFFGLEIDVIVAWIETPLPLAGSPFITSACDVHAPP